MTLPRQVLPGQFYLVTRRCTQRQFLLRPDAETNNAFVYCLADAARRFDIDVLLPVAMSNHYHAVIFDRQGTVPRFMEHFHKMLAKCQNALRGRWENMWASEQASLVRLVERGDIISKLVYVAANPVTAHLVERAHQWPGVNGLTPLLNGVALRARRPRHFFRQAGSMPEAVTLKLVLPAELGDEVALKDELRRLVEAAEAAARADRLHSGRRIVGRARVRGQPWTGSPASIEPRGGLRPRIAAQNRWARIEAIRRDQGFLISYREARTQWSLGLAVTFPAGTYWLRRFAGVPFEVGSPVAIHDV